MTRAKNVFREMIKDASESRGRHEAGMMSFSENLAEAMGLGHQELKQWEENDMGFNIGDYVIKIGEFTHGNAWRTLLYAIPKNGLPRAGWHYDPRSAGMVVYPESPGIQAEILRSVREYRDGQGREGGAK